MTTPLEPHRTPWCLRTCEIGTANIAVSFLFGTASLVCLGLGLVIPWWAAAAIACTGLVLAELWVDRKDSGESWSLTSALDRMEAFEDEERSARRADVPSSRDDLPAPVPGHVQPSPAHRRERSRGSVPVPARVQRPVRAALLSDRPAA